MADHAIDDMCADFFQTRRPVQIGFFIETRHQFHHHRHFLTLLGGIDQRFHDDGIGARTIDSLLDRHDLRIAGGLLDEFDYRGEALERMMQKDVLLLQHFKKILALRHPHQRLRQARRERRIFQIGPVHLIRHAHQANQVHRPVDTVDIDFAELELRRQKQQHFLRAVVGDFQPHRIAQMPLWQFALQRKAQVFHLFLIDEQVGISRGAKLIAAQHFHAGEQLADIQVKD